MPETFNATLPIQDSFEDFCKPQMLSGSPDFNYVTIIIHLITLLFGFILGGFTLFTYLKVVFELFLKNKLFRVAKTHEIFDFCNYVSLCRSDRTPKYPSPPTFLKVFHVSRCKNLSLNT